MIAELADRGPHAGGVPVFLKNICSCAYCRLLPGSEFPSSDIVWFSISSPLPAPSLYPFSVNLVASFLTSK